MIAGLFSVFGALGILGLCAILLVFMFAVGTAFSGIIVSAAPLCLALFLSINPVKLSWWMVFLFWFVLLYSLASYSKLRKAVTVVSASLMGGLIVNFLCFFVEKLLPESEFGLALVKLIMLSVCVILALALDMEKDNPFCINVSKFIHLPMIIQRLIAAVIYAIAGTALIEFSFLNLIGTSYIIDFVVGWVVPIVVGVAYFFLDGVIAGDIKDKNGFLTKTEKFKVWSNNMVERIQKIDIADLRQRYFSNRNNPED